jgi:1,4-alpha-glucan branching enzyme
MENSRHMENLLKGVHYDPFEFLGLHWVGNFSVVRVFNPCAVKVELLLLGENRFLNMEAVNDKGFYEAVIEKKIFFKDYKLKFFYESGVVLSFDAYSFPPVISDFDLYLFNEGKNRFIYRHLGAHVREVGGVKGVLFAVWAPNAAGVSVVGNFNLWDGRRHQMRVRGTSGVWEIFLPHLKEHELYKFEIRTKTGEIKVKSDPFAFYCELRPNTASIVYNVENDFSWTDSEWLKKRETGNNFKSPILIYELHLGSWKKGLNYRDIAGELVQYVKETGFTHVELLPVMEHPLDDSWGYQVTGYYAVTSRYGTPEDFKYFVNVLHENNIYVILDWVPAHFPKDSHGLGDFDGTHLFEHANPLKGYHPDWDTYIFNYSRNEVRNFLISNAVFWFEEYHIDALRIDAVASMLYLDYSRKEGEWEPNVYGGRENIEAIEFLKELNYVCYSMFKGISTIAEESTAWPNVTKPVHLGGLGFGFKWNMGWMNDTLSYFQTDPLFRKYHHKKITFSLWYAFSENFILVLSHDEVVHLKKSLISKMPGDKWQKFANLRLLFGYMWAHPGKKLIFSGGEIAQWNEWNFKESLNWELLKDDYHKNLRTFFIELNKLYLSKPAFYELDFSEKGFKWIDCDDVENSVISFLRFDSSGRFLVFVFNFTPVVREDYIIGVPEKGKYKEIFNSDSSFFSGSNIGNLGEVLSCKMPCHGFEHSISLTLPPLGFLILEIK